MSTNVKRFPVMHGDQKMPWAKGTVANGFVFLSGADGRDLKNDTIPASMRDQATLCLNKIKAFLGELGSSMEHIVRVNIYVTDLDEYFREQVRDGIIHEFYRKNCPSLLDVPPSQTLIQVAALARREMKIEIEVIAALPQ